MGRRQVASVLVAALAGGGIALGGAASVGGLGGSTTVVRDVEPPSMPAEPAAFRRSHSLTINEIYRAAAPGVVQVTSTTVVEIPPDPFFGNPFGPTRERQQALGSGFVI